MSGRGIPSRSQWESARAVSSIENCGQKVDAGTLLERSAIGRRNCGARFGAVQPGAPCLYALTNTNSLFPSPPAQVLRALKVKPCARRKSNTASGLATSNG